MTRMLLWRALQAALTLVVVSVLVFAATQALPGDAAIAKLGKDGTPEAVAALRDQLGLHGSVAAQYGRWIGRTLTGDPGVSVVNGEPVGGLVGDRIGYSLLLMAFATLLAAPLGLALGVVAAARRDGAFDRGSSLVLLTLAAVPEFVLGIALVILLSTGLLHLLPAVSLIDPTRSVFGQLDLLLLPSVTLALVVVPYIARSIRASMIEVLESDYVAMARLKGLPERDVIVRHALVNAVGPTIQVLALSLAYLAGGVVVVEAVFGFPGIGQALVTAVQTRDVPVIQLVTLMLASVYLLANVLADVATVLVTPRLRTAVR